MSRRKSREFAAARRTAPWVKCDNLRRVVAANCRIEGRKSPGRNGAERMNGAAKSSERPRAWICAWAGTAISIGAAVAVAYGIWLGLGTADTEPLESPLMLSVARQLEHGPWSLYGPFGRQNPLVLIHAPLYYHLAAFLAWPLWRAGIDSITAARLAGRAISLFGLVLTGWSAFRIARLDAARRRAGWWAACLIASAPVLGAMPYTVRSDILGACKRRAFSSF